MKTLDDVFFAQVANDFEVFMFLRELDLPK